MFYCDKINFGLFLHGGFYGNFWYENLIFFFSLSRFSGYLDDTDDNKQKKK